MSSLYRRDHPDYIKKSLTRLAILADIDRFTDTQSISQALNSWGHCLAPVQAAKLESWLQTSEIKNHSSPILPAPTPATPRGEDTDTLCELLESFMEGVTVVIEDGAVKIAPIEN